MAVGVVGVWRGGGTMRERIRTPGATGVEGAGGAWLQCRRAVAGRGLGTRWRRRKLSQINVVEGSGFFGPFVLRGLF